MFDFEPLDKSLASWQVYSPVLRAKSSEWKALTALPVSIRHSIMPIFEFVPEWRGPSGNTSRPARSPQTPEDYVRLMIERSVQCTPHTSKAFAYFGHAGPNGRFHAVDLWSEFVSGVPNGALIYPLADLSAGAGIVPQIKAAVNRVGGAVGIRITAVDLNTSVRAKLDAMVRALETDAASTHLIVDLKDTPRFGPHSNIRKFVAPSEDYASIIVLAGVFPTDLTGYQPGITAEPRQEWLFWQQEHQSTPQGERFLSYGDYTTQCARYQPSPSVPGSVSLRYTTDDAILVFRGKQSNSGAGLGYEQIHGHCRLLVKRPEYDGAVFSAGDHRMYCWTDPTRGTGNPEQWRTACLTHHITHVVAQLGDPSLSSATKRAWARAQAPGACQ